jgi:1-deoxy-D-xylulose-5-phosphate reductoisomerase
MVWITTREDAWLTLDSDVKRLVILGSTGSIGQQALDVVRAHPERFRIVGLAAGRNRSLLRTQLDEFGPRYYSAADGPLSDSPSQFLPLSELASVDGADLVLVATVGATGIEPTLAALGAGHDVALANKEVLVVAGRPVTEAARAHGVSLLPVDSEHSAIWQCLRGEAELGAWSAESPVERLVLTASGGAFRDLPIEALAGVTPEQALHHPNWVMGPKVTVDSATLLNKGFEVIEAHWLFGVPYAHIDVVLHRESMVHSLVTFVDGTMKAQLGPPDMRLPIQYALGYPDRLVSTSDRLDLPKLGLLSFGPVDVGRYPCFRLAMDAAHAGQAACAALSGADEGAVSLFTERRIKFSDIPVLIERVLARQRPPTDASVETLIATSAWAEAECRSLAKALA